jgi:hypothetical protein
MSERLLQIAARGPLRLSWFESVQLSEDPEHQLGRRLVGVNPTRPAPSAP